MQVTGYESGQRLKLHGFGIKISVGSNFPFGRKTEIAIEIETRSQFSLVAIIWLQQFCKTEGIGETQGPGNTEISELGRVSADIIHLLHHLVIG